MTDSEDGAACLVIGYGNTLRRDDGVGWWVVEALAGRVDPGQVRMMTCHQLTVELAGLISGFQQVILVDAAKGMNPGAVDCCEVTPDPVAAQSMLHYMTPEALLTSALALYGIAPRTRLVTIVGGDFTVGEGLTPEVAAAIPDAVERIVSAAALVSE